MRATYWAKKNFIEGLNDVSGNWIKEEKCIYDVARHYFEDLFMAGSHNCYDHVEGVIQ